jgi:predicted protein tyrosine phosphatase
VIIVSSYWTLKETIKQYAPTHLISLMDTRNAVPTPKEIIPQNHLKLGFHDVDETTPNKTAPTSDDILEIIGFGSRWSNLDTPVLIHCTAGVSRSPAAALILAIISEPGDEARIARLLRLRAPYCEPNKLMIELADARLGLEGRLISAVQKMDVPDSEGATPQHFIL